MIKVTFGKVIDNILQDVGVGTNRNPVTQVGTIKKSSLKKLDILTGGTDINVLIHDKPNIDIVLETFEGGPQLKMSHDDDTATVEAVGGERTGFLSFNHSSNCLQIKVPLDIAESWNIKTGSGDVMIPKMRTNSCHVVLGSGDLELLNLKAKEARIHTSSGDMFVRDVVVDTLEFGTTSGDAELVKVRGNRISGVANSGGIKINDVYSEKFTAKVTSGDVSINDIQVGEIYLTCSSGDVEAENIETNRANLRASSGDIRYTFTNDCSIQGTATSGDIVIICKSKQPNATIDVQTSSGDIDTNLPQYIHQQSDNRLTGVVGSGEHLIELKTSSGDVELLYR